jgi:hypothetical protein
MNEIAETKLDDLAKSLGDVCGCNLRVVVGSVIDEGQYICATATSKDARLVGATLRMDVLAKIFIAPSPSEASETWALVFFYIDGIRVSPPGVQHLRLHLERDSNDVPRWMRVGWEEDEFDEWSSLERFVP